MHVET